MWIAAQAAVAIVILPEAVARRVAGSVWPGLPAL
jgi:hypothetical protein